MPKLTDRFLAALTVEEGRKDRLVFDSVCPGLGVRVTKKGTRTFLAQWTDPATKRKVREPIGVWGALTIDQAREAVRVRLGAVAKGLDPKTERLQRRTVAERQRAELALTFEALVDEWAALHLSQRRERYRTEAVRAIKFTFKQLLKQPAARVTRADAVNMLDKLVRDGKASMASRTLAYARAAFEWAKKRAKVEGNPFQGLPISTVTTARERVLNDAELAEVWNAARSLSYPFGPFFAMLILTLQRRSEVAGMRWSEIAGDLSRWSIPGARMKNGSPHDVHLPEAAQVVLRAVPRIAGCDFVFTTTASTAISGLSKAKTTLDGAVARLRVAGDATAARMPPWRLHDLRRTGVTTLARLGFDSIVVDKILAHQPAKLRGVAAVYQRHDFGRERAAALDEWARHVTGSPADNVILLRNASR